MNDEQFYRVTSVRSDGWQNQTPGCASNQVEANDGIAAKAGFRVIEEGR